MPVDRSLTLLPVTFVIAVVTVEKPLTARAGITSTPAETMEVILTTGPAQTIIAETTITGIS